MRRLLFALVMVLLGACSVDEANTTAAATRFEMDQDLIGTVWDGYTQSWTEGRPAALRYIEAHNHPDLGFTASDFECAYDALPDDFYEEAIVDTSSAIRDDGWAWPGSVESPSPIDGETPRGRIYTVDVEQAFVTPGFDPTRQVLELHVAIVEARGGEAAYFFLAPNC